MSAVAKPVDIGLMITCTPGIKGGTPRIVGTGVTVRTIVRWYKLGLTPEEIAADYPHAGLDKVYAALAYYHANRAQLDAEFAEEEAESDRIEAEHLDSSKCSAWKFACTWMKIHRVSLWRGNFAREERML